MLLLRHHVRSTQSGAPRSETKLPSRLFLGLLAYLQFMLFDLFLGRGNFLKLHDRVRNFEVRARAPLPGDADRILQAIELASIFYWKRIACLQRSAVTACLLRKFGLAAQMVTGAQQVPFRAHAWVELEGQVANDKPYVREIYAVLDRC